MLHDRILIRARSIAWFRIPDLGSGDPCSNEVNKIHTFSLRENQGEPTIRIMVLKWK